MTRPVIGGQVQKRFATFAPSTYDAASHSVEAVFSTGARRRTWYGFEELEVSPAAVDLSRIALGQVRALDSHNDREAGAIAGSVPEARVEQGALRGRITFATTAKGQEIEALVAAGDLRGLSVGYTIEAMEKVGVEADVDIWRVTRWTLCEVSWVSVPADPTASVRSNPQPTPSGASAVTMENDMRHRLMGGAAVNHDAPNDQGAANAAPAAVQRSEINRQIRSAARTYGIPSDFSDELIDRGASIDSANTAILAEAARRQEEQTSSVAAFGGARATDATTPQQRAEAMGEALFARRHAGHDLSDRARPYAYMSVVDMARSSLHTAGVSVTGLPPIEIIQRSIGMHTTSDLPAALAGYARRELAVGYASVEGGLRDVAKPTTAQDFRTKSKVSLDTDARLEKLTESGEIKQGKMVDGVETYRIDTYAKSIAITRQALVNDDLDALGDLTNLLGQESAAFEADFLVKMLEGPTGVGPKMGDNQFLFHASHNNLGTAAGIMEASVSAGRLAMRRQKKPGGSILRVGPKFLVVPPELETAGEKFIAEVSAATTADTNTFAGKLTVVVEAGLTSPTRWYLVGDPAQVPGLEYAYLAGAPGPQVKTFEPHNQDGLLTRVILDFGAGFTDFRGWYANPGQ